jgi:hypothetical protein
MQRLINNRDEYETVLKGLRKAVLKPEYYDGTFINDRIMRAFDSSYVRPDLSTFEKQQAFSIEDFFA